MLTGQLGPYTLVKKIAVGGMAEIYHAIVPDTEPLRQVAIKVIHPNNSEDPDFVRMLLDEARLAVRLKHPNIVTTYDLGKEKEQYYLVMELVEGVDLFRLEQRSTEHRLSIPVPLAAYIVREVARGLHFAHELTDATGKPLQVVHRDVSPHKIMPVEKWLGNFRRPSEKVAEVVVRCCRWEKPPERSSKNAHYVVA